MVELTEEAKDLNNCPAFHAIDEVQKDGAITKEECDLQRSHYAKLHDFVLQTYDNQRNFLVQAKSLSQRLMSEKIKLEKTGMDSQEYKKSIEQLRDQTKEIQNEFDAVNERETLLGIQRSELEQDKNEKMAQLNDLELSRKAEAEPKIQRLRGDIEQLMKEIEHYQQSKEEHDWLYEDYVAKIKHMEEEMSVRQEVLRCHEEEHAKIKDDPGRIKKQTEKFESAVASLMQAREEKRKEIESLEESSKKNWTQHRDKEDLRSQASVRLNRVAEIARTADDEYEETLRSLAHEKNIYSELLLKRIAHERELEDLQAEDRFILGECSQSQKLFDRLKRQYKKAEAAKIAMEEANGPLQAQKKDMIKELKKQQEETLRQSRQPKNIEAEVDTHIGACVKQEMTEKEKKEECDANDARMRAMEQSVKAFKEQEQTWKDHHKTLTAQREKLAQNASKAHRLHRETKEEVQMKRLEEDELNKKKEEITQRQKDYCSVYETVEREKQKHQNNIQTSNQQLAEMKEKVKVLQNEVDILKMESAHKDNLLREHRKNNQELDTVQSGLQNEKMRIMDRGTELNKQVEQYLVEFDKLSSIINSIEKEMAILRRKYEQAVETRNFTGIQLIDRNDELCILWEKSNVQEKLLKRGEDAMLAKAEEKRSLKIACNEVERQLQVVRWKVPGIKKRRSDLMKERKTIRDQVESVRKSSDKLLREELENPNSSRRKFQKLGGEDLDRPRLRSKLQNLEERLNDKKEALLEKELILEEVTALSDKLRQQASEGRQDTMELSQKVNVFQSRIKEVTRKMMATVSELSMYQATAHKLQADRDEAHEQAMLGRELFHEGKPPTPNADFDFERELRIESQREADRIVALQRKQEEEIISMNGGCSLSAAVERVTGYKDEHDLQKAYGASAPFMPSAKGAVRRHIRKPNPKVLDV